MAWKWASARQARHVRRASFPFARRYSFASQDRVWHTRPRVAAGSVREREPRARPARLVKTRVQPLRRELRKSLLLTSKSETLTRKSLLLTSKSETLTRKSLLLTSKSETLTRKSLLLTSKSETLTRKSLLLISKSAHEERLLFTSKSETLARKWLLLTSKKRNAYEEIA